MGDRGEPELRVARGHSGEIKDRAQLCAVRRDGWTEERRECFLAHLARTSNVTASAKAAGMCVPSVYKLRARDPGFREAWAEALREGYEQLEMALLERARFGTRKPVFQGGKRVGSIRVYPDAVALRLLIAHRATVEAQRARDRADPAPAGDDGALLDAFRAKLAEMKARKEAGAEPGDSG